MRRNEMAKLSNLLCKALNQNNGVFIKQLNNEGSWTLFDLRESIKCLSICLKQNDLSIKKKLIGIAMRSSYNWIVSDLTILLNGCISLPVPLDFPDEQLVSLLGKVDDCIVNI